ncbi:MAG: hypothetical protein ACRD5H_06015 [Nitrososphaerales archaeon]
MEKALICNSSGLEAVYEDKDTHYFYWPVELGLGWIQLWKFKIPSFPLKKLDYEPVKSFIVSGKKVALTRFHYHVLVYFNELNLVSAKVGVNFQFGSHSPFMHTTITSAIDFGSNEHFSVTDDSREFDAFTLLLALFRSIVKGKLKQDNCNWLSYQLSGGNMPIEYLFDAAEMKAIVWIGNRPTDAEFKEIGYQY